jgi:MFS family permease
MHELRTEVSPRAPAPTVAALEVAVNAPAPSLSVPPLSLTADKAPAREGKRRWALRGARAIAEAVFSSEAGAPPAERIDWLASELGHFVHRAGWRSGGFYQLGLLLIAFVAPLLILRPVPVWRLSPEDRVRALQRMERRFASLVLPVKAILCIIYYEHPDAARETGYHSPCHPKVGP